MKAIVRDTYGSPDVLKLREIEKPELTDDGVLVRVHAASVARGDWYTLTGLYVGRAEMGYASRSPG
jgi:NADPH:quinone reductase-like Zn-dependent oxidoreductase